MQTDEGAEGEKLQDTRQSRTNRKRIDIGGKDTIFLEYLDRVIFGNITFRKELSEWMELSRAAALEGSSRCSAGLYTGNKK